MTEFIVVVSIIVIILSITISNFSQIRLQFSLSRVAYKFAQDVRRAQDMAMSSVQYKDANGVVQSISGYGVYIDPDTLGSKKYIIYADKAPGNQKYDASDYTVETIDFSKTEPGVKIKEILYIDGANLSINYNSSDLKTTITNPGNNSGVNVYFSFESDVTVTKKVGVNISGLIEVP